MPSAAIPSLRLSATEYLAWDREQPERHDYYRGEVFAMAGGSPRHARLVAEITIQLGIAHRGRPCVVQSTDQRIVARDQEHYGYADASVVCERMVLAPGTKDTLANPTVVVEVLSKTTEAYDRGLKWEGYRGIASLTDYLLVSQSTGRIEHFQRQGGADGDWRYRAVEAGGRVVLSNGATLDVDAVYRGAFDLEGE